MRESLGAVLLLNENAIDAEKVFREDLDRNLRNPGSLFGLAEALHAQSRAYDAQFIDKQCQSNWKSTEMKLKVMDLTQDERLTMRYFVATAMFTIAVNFMHASS